MVFFIFNFQILLPICFCKCLYYKYDLIIPLEYNLVPLIYLQVQYEYGWEGKWNEESRKNLVPTSLCEHTPTQRQRLRMQVRSASPIVAQVIVLPRGLLVHCVGIFRNGRGRAQRWVASYDQATPFEAAKAVGMGWYWFGVLRRHYTLEPVYFNRTCWGKNGDRGRYISDVYFSISFPCMVQVIRTS